MTLQYWRDAQGILLVYDVTDEISFENLEYWIQQIQNNESIEEISIVIVGNEIDLENERKVTSHLKKVYQ